MMILESVGCWYVGCKEPSIGLIKHANEIHGLMVRKVCSHHMNQMLSARGYSKMEEDEFICAEVLES